MCVVVRNNEIKVSDEAGRKYYQEVLSYQQKGIDGELKGTNLPAFLASAGRSRRVCCGSMISHPVLQPDASRALTDKRGIGDVMSRPHDWPVPLPLRWAPLRVPHRGLQVSCRSGTSFWCESLS